MPSQPGKRRRGSRRGNPALDAGAGRGIPRPGGPRRRARRPASARTRLPPTEPRAAGICALTTAMRAQQARDDAGRQRRRETRLAEALEARPRWSRFPRSGACWRVPSIAMTGCRWRARRARVGRVVLGGRDGVGRADGARRRGVRVGDHRASGRGALVCGGARHGNGWRPNSTRCGGSPAPPRWPATSAPRRWASCTRVFASASSRHRRRCSGRCARRASGFGWYFSLRQRASSAGQGRAGERVRQTERSMSALRSWAARSCRRTGHCRRRCAKHVHRIARRPTAAMRSASLRSTPTCWSICADSMPQSAGCWRRRRRAGAFPCRRLRFATMLHWSSAARRRDTGGLARSRARMVERLPASEIDAAATMAMHWNSA